MDALQQDLAQRLRAAYGTGVPIAPIREWFDSADVDAAYACLLYTSPSPRD